MSTSLRLNDSLFDLLLAHLSSQTAVLHCTESTLIQLSLTLQEIILSEQFPAVIYIGFKEAANWLTGETRYRQIAETAKQIYVFGATALPSETNLIGHYIQLASDDSLCDERFIIIQSDRFNIVLCSKGQAVQKHYQQEFEAIISFEPAIINTALDLIKRVLMHYQSTSVEEFQALRRIYPPEVSDPRLVSQCFSSILHYEEQLQQNLILQKRLTDTLLQSIAHHLYGLSIKKDETLDLEDVFAVVYQSPNFERLCGYPVQNLLDDISFWETTCIYPDDRPKYDDFLSSMVQGKNSEITYRIIHADGSIRWISDAVTVIPDEAKQMIMVYGVAEDITELKRMQEFEREQEHLQLELEKQRELAKLKNQFMYNISHEFRVPLTTIMLSTEMLLRYQDRIDKQASEAKLRTVQSQVRHLRQMIDDIWTILNDELGQTGFNPQPTFLRTFFEETIQDLTLADEGRHILRLEINALDQEYPIDNKLLKQTVINLISNAIKYSGDGTEICCTVEADSQFLKIYIKDHGIGISEEDQIRLFEPFFRGDNVGQIGGAGLGLRIVQDCVSLQRGTIRVESALNRGTTFIVHLSLQK